MLVIPAPEIFKKEKRWLTATGLTRFWIKESSIEVYLSC